jgi:DNA-binding IclR family transcriptional regulator
VAQWPLRFETRDMARPAPSTDRVVSLLEFLAREPDRSFGLSELGRRLDMSKATLHAMTAALTDVGWLVRRPGDKTYRLGPALVGIGQAAAARELELVEFARDEMQRLADELRVRCMASTVIGDEIVMLATAGRARPLGLHLQVGQRLPLVPPLGIVFLAWADDAEVDAWLDRSAPPDRASRDAQRSTVPDRDLLALVRRRGYSIGIDPVAAHSLAADSFEQVVWTMPVEEYLLRDLEPGREYPLSHMAAPVFGPEAEVALAITLVEFREVPSGARVADIADRLLEAARTVTKAIHGKAPDNS